MGKPYATERVALLAAARAGAAFHDAMESCGGDPGLKESHVSATGRDLDSLYAEWQQLNATAIELVGLGFIDAEAGEGE